MLRIYDKKPITIEHVFEKKNLFLTFFLAGILYFLIVAVGLILLVIPGIIFMIMYSLYSYLIVDKNLGPVEALNESARITKGNRWKLFLFFISLIGLNILGLLLLVVGLLVTIPISFLALVCIYRDLLRQKGSKKTTKKAKKQTDKKKKKKKRK